MGALWGNLAAWALAFTAALVFDHAWPIVVCMFGTLAWGIVCEVARRQYKE